MDSSGSRRGKKKKERGRNRKIMDEHTLRVLEFDKILDMAAGFAVTSPGKALIRKTRPLGNPEAVRCQINIISECKSLLAERKTVGIESFHDLSPLFF